MAASFCLPKKYSSVFLDALKSGKLNPDDLRGMSSAERRSAFSEILGGDENARQVNTLFESKLLLKDQQKGMIEWAKSVGGLNEKTRQTIVDKIQSMDQILQPADEKSFLEDLARDKLGASVTAEEAQKLFDASEDVKSKQSAAEQDPNNLDKRIDYGRSILDLRDMVEEMKPNGRSFVEKVLDVASIPKSMLTSILHFSAPFVQGYGLIGTKVWAQGFGQMFKYFADEENFQNLRAYIITHPDYPLAVDGKLGLTDLSDKLSNREEAIQSTLVQKASELLSDKTGIPDIVRASSRAFVGYLNYIRFNRFTDLLNAARNVGEDVQVGSSVVRDLAKVVNDFTGRGALGKDDVAASIGPFLNTVFFAPRKISATVEMFDPLNYVNNPIRGEISPTAKSAAMKQLAGMVLVTGSVISLARAMGASVNLDPRSADFLKIGIGTEKLDMTGGNAIYLRLIARIFTGQEITPKGKEIDLGQGYKPTTRADLVSQYVRGKLSPIAGLLADSLYGSDPIGRPFSVTDEAKNKLLPITVKSFMDFSYDDPKNTAAIIPALSAIFGVSLESPLPPLSKTGLTVWGDSVSVWHDPVRNNIDTEFNRLGYTPGFPGQTINGVKLTDDQYHTYVGLAGHSAKVLLNNLISSPGWSKIPDAQKLSLMKSIVLQQKTTAQTAVMMQSIHTDNDIFAKSMKNYIDKLNGTTQP